MLEWLNYQNGQNDQFIILYICNSIFLDTRVIFNKLLLTFPRTLHFLITFLQNILS